MASSLSSFVTNIRITNGKPPGGNYTFTRSTDYEASLVLNRSINLTATGIPNNLKDKNIAKFQNDFGFYIYKIDLPHINHGSGKTLNIGEALGENNMGISRSILTNNMTLPQELTVKITFRDTEDSIIEGLILPWMYINDSPKGALSSGNIKSFTQSIIGLLNVKMVRPPSNIYRTYSFVGLMPIAVETPNFTEEKSEVILRTVTFAFSTFKVA